MVLDMGKMDMTTFFRLKIFLSRMFIEFPIYYSLVLLLVIRIEIRFSAICPREIILEKNRWRIWIWLPSKPLIRYSYRWSWEIFFSAPKNDLAIFFGQKNFFLSWRWIRGFFRSLNSNPQSVFCSVFLSAIYLPIHRITCVKIENLGRHVTLSGSKI